MKILLLRVIFIATLFNCLYSNKAFGQTHTPRFNVSLVPNSGGFYEYLPVNYNAPGNTQRYPLICFSQGLGELGNGNEGELPKILWVGLPAVINNGGFPATFNVNGETFSFIVISPQFRQAPSVSDWQTIINYAVQNYRVDVNRVYFTGLSNGGGMSWEYPSAQPSYANRLAGIVPICGSTWPSQAKARVIADANLPVWATHNDLDQIWSVQSTIGWVDQINTAPLPNPLAKKTIFLNNGSHDAWSTTYAPWFREDGKNIYEWMLQYHRNFTGSNQAPIAIGGGDLNLGLQFNYSVLNGANSWDIDGYVTAYNWTKRSGPAQYTLSNTTVSSPFLSNLVEGRYVFELAVTDNQGAIGIDSVVVNVFPVVKPIPGKIEAETYNAMLGVQIENTTDTGGGSDLGYISADDWMDYSVNVASPGLYNVSFRVASVLSGAQLQLRKSDGTVLATVTVPQTGGWQIWNTVTANNVTLTAGNQTLRVYSSSSPSWNFNWMDFLVVNQSPSVNAGPPQTIISPALSQVTLTGNATAYNGSSITTYDWLQISGTTATITNPSSASTTVTGLTTLGNCVFRLTATDNLGRSGTSDVTITVNPPGPPVANAGAAKTIQLPTSQVTLSGSGSANNGGSIIGYTWSQVSGTAATIVSPTFSSTTVTGITTSGAKVFRLTVTDNDGTTSTSDVTITVLPVNLSTPYGGTRRTIPGKLEAEDYDNGGQNIAYYDGTAANSGYTLRLTESVDLRSCPDVGGGYCVGWTTDGEWMKYSVNVATTGLYTFTLRAASPNTGKSIQLEVDGTIAGTLIATNSGGFNSWQTSTLNNVPLTAGNRTFRFIINTGDATNTALGFDINWFNFDLSPNQPPAANAGLPQTIQFPANSAILTGTGSTPNSGGTVTYAWIQIGGPNSAPAASITTPTAATTNVTGLVLGAYVFRLTVTDNLGGTATSDVTIVVNQPPSADAGPNQTIILPVSQVTLTGTGVANNGGIITSLWTKVSGPNSAPALSIVTPTATTTNITGLVLGVYVFRLTVTDNFGGTATSDVTVTVNPGPPSANAGLIQHITLPVSQVTLTGTGAANNGGTITTYSWIRISGPNADPELSIATPGAASTVVTGLIEGVYVFSLTVTDNDGGSTTSDVTITVNQPPTANAGTNQIIILPVSQATLNGTGVANNGGTITYGWTRVSGPNTSPELSIITPDAANTLVTGLIEGVYVFRLTVTDNYGGASTSNVSITVNRPPTASAGANQIIILPVSQVTLTGTGTANNGGTITTYSWIRISGPNTDPELSIVTPGAASTVVTGLIEGVYVFSLTVTDNDGGISTSDVTITVVPPGPPDANAGPDQTIVLPVSQVTLTGTGAANNGGTITYDWTQVSGTAATITSPSSSTTTVTGLITSGIRVFRLTVTDNDGRTTTSDVTITVYQPPTVNAGAPQTIQLPISQVTLTGTGVANNGGTITYAWTRVSGPNASPSLAIISPTAAGTTVTGLIQGVYVFRLTVTDNDGTAATSDVAITVNQPPTANAGTAQTIQLPVSQVTLNGTGIANNGGTITYAWTRISGPNTTPALSIVSPTVASTLVTGMIEGPYVFRLTVTDNLGGIATSDVTITVLPVNLSTPYGGTRRTIPGKIEAEDYDSGGQNIAYNDGTAVNSGTAYRPAEFVDLGFCGDTGGGYGIGWTMDGEWVKYSVNVTTAGIYILTARIASPNTGKSMQFLVDGAAMGTLAVANTGGFGSWQTITLNNVLLTAGNHTLQFNIITGSTTNPDLGFDINWFNFALAPNQSPTANAGSNQTINLPTNQVTLTGSGAANNGGTITYAWTQVSGTAATIASPSSATTNITGLTTTGARVFRLTVTRNDNQTATSDVTVTVNPVPPPTANAGSNQTIILPTNQVSLTGTGTSGDGGAITYAWTQVSGTAATIASASSATTNITGLTTLGARVFRLTVTQSDNQTATSDVTITVNPVQPPTSNAGTAQTIQLPTNQVSLTGAGTAGDGGTITYAWTQVSGTAATITSPSSASTTVTGLSTSGARVFRLTVTQSDNQTATSDVTITVNPENASTPYGGTRRTIPGKIEAEDYDSGGQNIAYNDGTTANSGTAYRPAEAVDLGFCGDTGGGFSIGWTTDGEWVIYSVNVTTTGTYIFTARVGTPNTGKSIQFQVDGATVGTLTVPNTGAYSTWQTATLSTNVQLTAGEHTLRFLFNTGNLTNTNQGFDINWFNFALAPNQSPTANAGTNQTINLPTNQVTLTGSGAANNGGTITYAWTQVSGTAATIASASSATTNITGLTTTGARVFRLTVTRNDNQTATSDVTVTVNPVPPPTANAGSNQTIILPTNQVSLTGTGTSGDGGAITYAWTQVSGTAATIASASSATTNITGLTTLGARVFRLTVTQSDNQTATSDVTITVNPVQPPTANAGTAQTIQLPTNQVSLTGAGTAGDGGTITYAWTQVSGTAATITSPSSASTTVTGLTTSGARVFRLTVTQSDNQTATSDVTITVNSENASTPYGGTRRTIPGKLEAEDYDNGGQNIAYNDGTAANSGAPFGGTRVSEAVDVRSCPDVGGGYAIGWTTDGEWIKYSVNVTTTGVYTFTARIATPNTGKSIQLQVDGTTVGTLTVLNTGGYNNWQTATLNNISLTAGDHTFRFLFNTGNASNTAVGFDINWFNFDLVNATTNRVTFTEESPVNIVKTSLEIPVKIFPNPVTDQFVLRIDNDLAGVMKVQIIDQNGNISKTMQATKNKGLSQLYFSTAGISKGNYVIRIQIGSWNSTVKMIKL